MSESLEQAPTLADWASGLIESLAASGEVPDVELAVLRGQLDGLQGPPTALPPDPTVPEVVRTPDRLAAVAKKLAGADAVAIDLETAGLDPTAGEIVGVGLAAGGKTYYLPTAHRDPSTNALLPDQLPVRQVAEVLRLGELPLVAHNAKFELKWLRAHAGINPRFLWDTMIAALLLRSDLEAGLKDVALRVLDAPDWSLPKADINRVAFLPVDRVARYCAKDVYYAVELMRRQKPCQS